MTFIRQDYGPLLWASTEPVKNTTCTCSAQSGSRVWNEE